MVTDQFFIESWQGARNRQEVADACGCTPAAASMRARKLRTQGLQLKHFRPGRPRKMGATVVPTPASM